MTDSPSSSIVLRRASPGESDALTALARTAKASWGYPASWIAGWATELSIGADYIDTHRVMVACSADEIVGVAALEEREEHWMLEHVWVAPHMHRRGVGRMLVLDALEAARSMRAKPVRLASDPFAQKFYERIGAHVVGWMPAPVDGDADRRLPILEFALHGPFEAR